MKNNTKTFKVVMLPTEKESAIHLRNKKLTSNGSLNGAGKLQLFNPPLINIDKAYQYYNKQHLYIVSDEKIKEGDYWFNSITKDIGISNFKLGIPLEWDSTLKIVSSSDRSLGLPLIHDSFLPPFIKAYNEGKKIEELNLELNEPVCKCDTQEKLYKCPYACLSGEDCKAPNPNNDFYGLSPKVRKDNTVIIHQSKTYSKEDMIRAFNAGNNSGRYYTLIDFGQSTGLMDEPLTIEDIL